MARTYDAIVIGGGVMGASIAFHLARAGAGHVALVERREICAGNTRKSGAIVRMHYSNDPEARLALASLPYFQRWDELVGGDCGFRQTGFALLVGPENLERLGRNVARLQALGVETSALRPDEIRDVMPSLRTEGVAGQTASVAGAAYEPGSGYADAVATTQSLAEAARRLGADILQGTAVTAIEQTGGRVTGVRTDGDTLSAPVVVCAANTWSPALLKTVGVDLPVVARRAQTSYWDKPASYSSPHLVVLDTTTALYTRAHGDGQVLGGAADETGGPPISADQYSERPDPDFPGEVASRMRVRVPSLADARLARAECGLYDMSPDTRAILDGVPGITGLYVVAGFSGTGFKKAPAVGLGLAELITAGQATSVNLAPFRYSRFEEGAAIHGEDEYVLPQNWGHSF